MPFDDLESQRTRMIRLTEPRQYPFSKAGSHDVGQRCWRPPVRAWLGYCFRLSLRRCGTKSRETVMSLRLATGVLLAMAIGSAPALACKGREVLFEDKFQEEDAAWDISQSEGAVVTIGGGRLEIKPKEGWSRMVLYGGASFREGDICVDFVMPATKDPAVTGMLFWAANYGSLFGFWINTVGEAKILRRQISKDKVDTSTLVDWTATPAVKKGAGATNQLRVVLKGNAASTFINDRPFKNIKGIGSFGAQIGLFGWSEQTQPTAWQFTSVVVTQP
jgi:hypothetical protein